MLRKIVQTTLGSQTVAPQPTEADQRRDALRIAIAENGLTAASLARKSGLSNANSIYNFLSGASDSLSIETMSRLVRHLPRSDALKLTLGINQPRAVEGSHRTEIQATGAFRNGDGGPVEQVMSSISGLKERLAELQKSVSVCSSHLAVVEARLSDILRINP